MCSISTVTTVLGSLIGIPIIAMRLGQITMAVAVQMLVDTVLMRHSPAEVAVPWLVELHQKSKLGGFGAFF